jgi:hypothetical protein
VVFFWFFFHEKWFVTRACILAKREFDLGSSGSMLGNEEISVSINMMPDGLGRNFVKSDVRICMPAKMRRERERDSQQILASNAGKGRRAQHPRIQSKSSDAYR